LPLVTNTFFLLTRLKPVLCSNRWCVPTNLPSKRHRELFLRRYSDPNLKLTIHLYLTPVLIDVFISSVSDASSWNGAKLKHMYTLSPWSDLCTPLFFIAGKSDSNVLGSQDNIYGSRSSLSFSLSLSLSLFLSNLTESFY
jgi:hypothetical protein